MESFVRTRAGVGSSRDAAPCSRTFGDGQRRKLSQDAPELMQWKSARPMKKLEIHGLLRLELNEVALERGVATPETEVNNAYMPCAIVIGIGSALSVWYED